MDVSSKAKDHHFNSFFLKTSEYLTTFCAQTSNLAPGIEIIGSIWRVCPLFLSILATDCSLPSSKGSFQTYWKCQCKHSENHQLASKPFFDKLPSLFWEADLNLPLPIFLGSSPQGWLELFEAMSKFEGEDWQSIVSIEGLPP